VAIGDLRPTDETLALRGRVRAFMEEHVYPNVRALDREDDEASALVADLRARAKKEGLWPDRTIQVGGAAG
jgi:alkylation response protein AidB-like acyl-CoA dehydrogenase